MPINLGLGVLAMASTVHSHMMMGYPRPYGSLDTSPITQYNYPCHVAPGTVADGPMNELPVGSTQTLSFNGTAVHAGGSCQLSVTLDKTPTKDSKFKVIHSIVGGCPGVNGRAGTFDFKVPSSLPNGEAVFAWTWFNYMGNREMYMNCAKITVSGGSNDTTAFEALPNIAVANLKGITDCQTVENSDPIFPNPGESVVKTGNGPFVPLCGGPALPGGSGGSGNTSSAASGQSSITPGNNGQYTPGPGEGGAAQASTIPPEAPAVSSQIPTLSQSALSANSSAPVDAVTSTIRTLITITASSGRPIATAPSNFTSSVLSTNPSKTPASTAQPSPSSVAPTAPGAGAGNVACASDGQLVCNGETQFGLCNHGKVIWQAVAPGTKCQSGKILKKRGHAHRPQRLTY